MYGFILDSTYLLPISSDGFYVDMNLVGGVWKWASGLIQPTNNGQWAPGYPNGPTYALVNTDGFWSVSTSVYSTWSLCNADQT